MKRKLKIKKTIHGTDKMPRLSVFKSNKSIYIQAIDDVKNITLASTSSIDKTNKHLNQTMNKTQIAQEIGKIFAKKLKNKGINKGIFDRNGFKYIGRISSLALGARQAGLEF